MQQKEKEETSNIAHRRKFKSASVRGNAKSKRDQRPWQQKEKEDTSHTGVSPRLLIQGRIRALNAKSKRDHGSKKDKEESSLTSGKFKSASVRGMPSLNEDYGSKRKGKNNISSFCVEGRHIIEGMKNIVKINGDVDL